MLVILISFGKGQNMFVNCSGRLKTSILLPYPSPFPKYYQISCGAWWRDVYFHHGVLAGPDESRRVLQRTQSHSTTHVYVRSAQVHDPRRYRLEKGTYISIFFYFIVASYLNCPAWNSVFPVTFQHNFSIEILFRYSTNDKKNTSCLNNQGLCVICIYTC